MRTQRLKVFSAKRQWQINSWASLLFRFNSSRRRILIGPLRITSSFFTIQPPPRGGKEWNKNALNSDPPSISSPSSIVNDHHCTVLTTHLAWPFFACVFISLPPLVILRWRVFHCLSICSAIENSINAFGASSSSKTRGFLLVFFLGIITKLYQIPKAINILTRGWVFNAIRGEMLLLARRRAFSWPGVIDRHRDWQIIILERPRAQLMHSLSYLWTLSWLSSTSKKLIREICCLLNK